MQSWGSGAVNRRATLPHPTKSGVIGLLAAASGRARQDDISDLTPLTLGVRVDQPGTLLRDYHTVSDYRGRPLLQAGVNAKGVQKPTAPAKHTHVTTRYYLQDAVFVVAVAGPRELLTSLEQAVRAPAFPLALGRRACPPTQPLSLGLHEGDLSRVLRETPWQAPAWARTQHAKRRGRDAETGKFRYPARIDLSATLEDVDGDDAVDDVPVSFDPHARSFASRRVRHETLSVPTGTPPPGTVLESDTDDSDDSTTEHDPFALLGW
ncbi:type I-E CRISPR-associated protein Cas5/CasD [Streptomyces sp. O3]